MLAALGGRGPAGRGLRAGHPRGTILGTISDQTGAAMPGVTVVATETRTNVSYEPGDERNGQLHVPQHPGWDLQHQGGAAGLQAVVREAIRLA